MTNRIKEILREIQTTLTSYDSNTFPYSLYTKKAGNLLFRYLYNQVEFSDKFDVQTDVQELITLLINDSAPSYTFCTGISGTLWLLQYLTKKQQIYLDDDFFEDIDNVIASAASTFLNNRSYDFLHGAAGIIYVLLARPEKNRQLLEALTMKLLSTRINYKGHKVWQYFSYDKETAHLFQISLGLSHGIPSLIVLLSKLYKANICAEQCRSAINESYLFFKSIKNSDINDENFSFYPTMIKEGQNVSYTARLGWCYGDLGIGMAFNIAGNTLSNNDMIKESEDIYKYYASFTNLPKFAIVDSGFCHGAAGLMHMFRRMYLKTGISEYQKAVDYWLAIALEMAKYKDYWGGLRYWMSKEIGWGNNSALLDGTAGVGAVLSSYLLDQEPDWDECFLLS